MSRSHVAESFSLRAPQPCRLPGQENPEVSGRDNRSALRSKVGAASLILLFIALLTGCQTTHTFPTPDATWQTRVGQLQYIADGRAVVGECVVSTRPGDFQLEFSSGPGFPLMRLSSSGSTARAEGILARGSWQGQAANAPAPLRGWMRVAREFKRARRVSILSPETGERFHFVFTN